MSECRLNKFAMFALLRSYRRMNSMLRAIMFRIRNTTTAKCEPTVYFCVCDVCIRVHRALCTQSSEIILCVAIVHFIYLFFFRFLRNSLVPPSKSCYSRLHGICFQLFRTRRGAQVSRWYPTIGDVECNVNSILAAIMSFDTELSVDFERYSIWRDFSHLAVVDISCQRLNLFFICIWKCFAGKHWFETL